MNHSFNTDIAKDIGLIPAIILEHIAFWVLKNEANNDNCFEGDYWTYSSAKAFTQIFDYLSGDQIRRALDKLKEHGYIKTGNFNKSAYDRTSWYALLPKARRFYAISIPQKDKIDLANLPNGTGKNAEPIPDITTGIKTDIPPITPPKLKTVKKSSHEYSDDFEMAYAIYPRCQNSSKQKAYRAWLARISEGISPEVLIDGVQRYASYVRIAKTPEQYIKHPSTFFGPDAHYSLDWKPPERTKNDASDWINQLTGNYNDERTIDLH